MSESILSSTQKRFLSYFGENRQLVDTFYLTGGTALAEYYIPYRYSEDLDFFSMKEVDTQIILTFLKSIKKGLGYGKFDLNTSYNRNVVHLLVNKDILKLEFTYFPFEQVKKPELVNHVKVDSVIDIAVNKLFTIYQKPRSRDFMDLYMIHKRYHYQIKDLIIKAKLKFDWHIDPIKLGSQFLLAKDVKDYPKLITKLEHAQWQKYFELEAKGLGKKILK